MIAARNLTIVSLLLGAAVAVVAILAPVSAQQPPGPPRVPIGITQALQAQNRHTQALMAMNGVVGTATGRNAAGQPVIKVYLENAGVGGVPPLLDGIPVVVEVVGEIVALQCGPLSPCVSCTRPVPIGVSTGHPSISFSGTIGCRLSEVAIPSNVYALSNNHVYAAANSATPGDAVIQPSTSDEGSSPADDIGTLFAFEPIVFSAAANNTIDAAIALSSPTDLCTVTPADGYGLPKTAIVLPGFALGRSVKKYGRTTGLTTGTITGINATIHINYGAPGIARFVNQLVISPGGFSAGGDSGSLIVIDGGPDDRKAVGLLFAGSASTTFANPIGDVLAWATSAVGSAVIIDGEGACQNDPVNDDDLDGICNDVDNCPDDPNSDQANADGDAFGDVCDVCPNDPDNDIDGDGFCSDVDNCPAIDNADQADGDMDNVGDACDACPIDPDNDIDGDGVCGDVDPCPNDPDDDIDGDGLCADVDNCPVDPNADQANADNDTLGDACDDCPNDPFNDIEGDGVCTDVDNCPAVVNPLQENADGDALGDACDACPNDATNDASDGDGVCDDVDNCIGVVNADQANADSDGQGDACDACPNDPDNDADVDGVCGDVDLCPDTTDLDPVDANGCADVQVDGDGDGFCDPGVLSAGPSICVGTDNCPAVSNGDQADLDGDTLGNVCDACLNDAANDADGDGVCGDVDICPDTADLDPVDVNGCADVQVDSDGDGFCNPGVLSAGPSFCEGTDNCPAVPNGDQADADGDTMGDACDGDCPALADGDANFIFEPGDLSLFFTCFLQFCTDWPRADGPLTAARVSREGTWALRSDVDTAAYCCGDGLPPMNLHGPGECVSTTVVAGLRAIELAEANLARREIRRRGGAIDVDLRIRPPADSSAYALEEAVPVGLRVRAISHGGMYSQMHGAIRWGPFLDSEPRDLTYQLIAKDRRARIGSFDGVVAFDGRTVQIQGQRKITTLRSDALRDRPNVRRALPVRESPVGP